MKGRRCFTNARSANTRFRRTIDSFSLVRSVALVRSANTRFRRTVDSFIHDDDGQRRRKTTTTTHSVASERFLEREESSFERDNFRAVVSVGEEVSRGHRVLSVFPSTGFSERDVDVQRALCVR